MSANHKNRRSKLQGDIPVERSNQLSYEATDVGLVSNRRTLFKFPLPFNFLCNSAKLGVLESVLQVYK